MHILILKWINVKLGWFLTTRATTALLGPATESRRAVVRFGSRSLAIRKHLQQDVLRIRLHLNCRQWYLELLRYRSFPVASFPPYRWKESRALKDNESSAQIWEEYNGVPDDNNNRSARCKLGGSDSLSKGWKEALLPQEQNFLARKLCTTFSAQTPVLHFSADREYVIMLLVKQYPFL